MTSEEKLRVSVDEQYVGFILAEDVYKDKELKLLPKGEKLTGRLITALRNHGIRHIYVRESA